MGDAPDQHRRTVIEVLARALYEAQRASIRADDPLIALVGVPWRQAPRIVQEEWRQSVTPMADALAAAGLTPLTRTTWGVERLPSAVAAGMEPVLETGSESEARAVCLRERGDERGVHVMRRTEYIPSEWQPAQEETRSP